MLVCNVIEMYRCVELGVGCDQGKPQGDIIHQAVDEEGVQEEVNFCPGKINISISTHSDKVKCADTIHPPYQ